MARTRAASHANMADVGRLAGVSTQTVSRYFTGVGYVRTDTRDRIAAAIDELGYVPNQAARNLRAQRTNTIGVLSMGGLNYGASEVLTGLGRAARQTDVTLLIAQLDLDFEAKNWEAEAKRALEKFQAARVDGIVLSTPLPGADNLLRELARDTPVITVSELPSSTESSAGTHSHTAGLEATRHLIGLGHSDILHVAGPATRNEASERRRGYLDAMTEAHLEPQVISTATDWSSSSGFHAGGIADPATFTAVFAANDEIALGFMSAMAKRGVSSPSDFSIVGVDDMPTAAFFSPPLTSMRLDFRALGAGTFEMLYQRILTGEQPPHYVVEPELVIRESTGALMDSASALPG
jgi:DNA-binding LacI/PurR family transcriptional regulator